MIKLFQALTVCIFVFLAISSTHGQPADQLNRIDAAWLDSLDNDATNNDPANIRQFVSDRLADIEAQGNPETLAAAYQIIGRSYFAENNNAAARSFFEKGLRYVNDGAYPLRQFVLLRNIGATQINEFTIKGAYETYSKALALAIAHDLEKETILVRSDLAVVLSNSYDHAGAIEVLMPTLEAEWNPAQKAYAHARVGNNYRELGEVEKSIPFYEKGIATMPPGQPRVLAFVYSYFAQALNDLGRHAEADALVKQVTELEAKHGFVVPYQLEVFEAARIAHARGDYKSALALGLRALEDDAELTVDFRADRDVRILPQIIDTLRALGQTDEASQMLDRLLASQAHNFDNRRASLLSISEARFNLAERESQIDRLVQQAEIDRLRLQQQTLFSLLSLLAAIGILGLGLLIYKNNRKQRKANVLLEARSADIRNRARNAETALAQSETMFHELDHRLKNNLQTIISLLNVHRRNLGEGTVGEASGILQDVTHRVQTMALIQRRLVRRDDTHPIAMGVFITELAEQLVETVGKPVQVNVTAGDWVFAEVVSTPIAMIVNELVSNTLKHAFGEAGGVLDIELREEVSGSYFLTLQDDGVGLPENFNIETLDSMGLQLVQSLSQQIDGDLSFDNSGRGVKWIVRFMANSKANSKANS